MRLGYEQKEKEKATQSSDSEKWMWKRHDDIVLNIQKEKNHSLLLSLSVDMPFSLSPRANSFALLLQRFSVTFKHITCSFDSSISFFLFLSGLLSSILWLLSSVATQNTRRNRFNAFRKSGFVYASTTRSWCRVLCYRSFFHPQIDLHNVERKMECFGICSINILRCLW